MNTIWLVMWCGIGQLCGGENQPVFSNYEIKASSDAAIQRLLPEAQASPFQVQNGKIMGIDLLTNKFQEKLVGVYANGDIKIRGE